MTDYSFKSTNPLLKALVFLVIMVLMALLGSFISLLIGVFGYDFSLGDFKNIVDGNVDDIGFLKWFQLVTSTCLFIGTPLIFAAMQTTDIKGYFHFQSYKPSWLTWFAVFGFILLGPFITQLVEWSEASGLSPNSDNIQLTEDMIYANNFMGLLGNLIIVALIPALGEEMFFRGVVQKGFINATKIPWLGIVISAMCFSFFHMEMNVFFSRWIMGIFLGVLFYTSRSIWLPILAHFINNSTIVVLYYLYLQKSALVKTNPLEEDMHPSGWLVALSAVLFILMIQQAYMHRKILQNTWTKLFFKV